MCRSADALSAARNVGYACRECTWGGVTPLSSSAPLKKGERVGRVEMSQRSRRIALAFAATVVLTLACVGDGGVNKGIQGLSAQTQSKPNIIFVLTDDQFPGTENKMTQL